MLRVDFLQQWFNLTDPAMEEALYDTPMFREFAQLDMGEDHLPDESTILRFRHLLEVHDLSLQILATVNATLFAKGLLLKRGTVVNATLIAAPSLTKNSTGTRDSDMHQTQKSNQRNQGTKAHIGSDSATVDIQALTVASGTLPRRAQMKHLYGQRTFRFKLTDGTHEDKTFEGSDWSAWQESAPRRLAHTTSPKPTRCCMSRDMQCLPTRATGAALPRTRSSRPVCSSPTPKCIGAALPVDTWLTA